MALRKHKPLPKFRDPPPPTVTLSLDEAKALRACAMGDAISTEHLNTAIQQIDAVLDLQRQSVTQEPK